MKGFNKKISKTGAVTIPAALRREYGLAEGERFNIAIEEDGAIRLTRTKGSCLFDESEQDLILFGGRFICARCVERMSAAARALKGGDAE